MNKRFTCLIQMGFVLSSLAASQASVVFVDGRATICGDGQTWTTAYKYLQDALTAARNSGGTITEIRVAVGTYQPDRDCANPTGTGDRTATFSLIDGVALKGGYAGLGSPDPDARDITANTTILSGDLAGNDGPNFANNGENSYHVTSANVVGSATVIDGFTITGGNANNSIQTQYYYGGGMYSNISGSPTLIDCTFISNKAYKGGGIYNNYGNPMLINCTFNANAIISYGGGGGMYNDLGNPSLSQCTFNRNTGSSYTCGGGIYSYGGSPTLTHCSFRGNLASTGGGMYNYDGDPLLTFCTFNENSAPTGAGIYNHYAELTLTNCVFTGNTASNEGGGMFNIGCNPLLTNCTFGGNIASYGGGMYNHSDEIIGIITNPSLVNCILWGNSTPQVSDTATITYSCIEGGWEGTGNISSDPKLIYADGGNVRLRRGSPCIDAGNNSAVPSGMTTDLDGNPRFLDDLETPNTGSGTPPIVDMGPYEYVLLIPGDFDRDDDVDLTDFGHIQACLTGPGIPPSDPACMDARIDVDDDVDWDDMNIVIGCLSGSHIPTDPNCAN